MTKLQVILACFAVLTWVAGYALYWQANILRWWRGRHRRRAVAALAAKNKAEDHRRLTDNLARKYPLPPGTTRPPGQKAP